MILGRTGRCRPCQRSRSEFRVIRRNPGRPRSQLYQFYQSSALSDLRHGIISWPIHEVEEAKMIHGCVRFIVGNGGGRGGFMLIDAVSVSLVWLGPQSFHKTVN